MESSSTPVAAFDPTRMMPAPPFATHSIFATSSKADGQVDFLENKIIVNEQLRDVVLKNCHVVNCKLTNVVIISGWFASTTMTDVEIKHASILLSCVLDNCQVADAQLTNCRGSELAMNGVSALDSEFVDSEIAFGHLTKCSVSNCALEHLHLIDVTNIKCGEDRCTVGSNSIPYE